MRITFDVQNGMVQSEEEHHLPGLGADMEGEEIGDGEADDERRSQIMKQNFAVFR